MRLTDGQFWGGIVVLYLTIITVVVGFLVHWRKIDKDILDEDREALKDWAYRYAKRLAQKMFREYVRNLVITFPIELINESDIEWGDDNNGNK